MEAGWVGDAQAGQCSPTKKGACVAAGALDIRWSGLLLSVSAATAVGGLAGGRCVARGGLFALFHGSLAAEADAALFILAEQFHPDLVAELDDVFDLLDAEVGELADMHQTFAAREKLHERSEVLDGHDLGPIDLADFQRLA